MTPKERIAYPENPVMATCWIGCLQWALGKEELRKSFAEDRGRPLILPPESFLDALIDGACGVDYKAEVDEFVDWFNRVVWGEDPFTGEVFGGGMTGEGGECPLE